MTTPRHPVPTSDHIRRIQAIVARRYGLTTVEMFGKTQIRTVTEARHVALYLCRVCIEPMPSYTELSVAFGMKDHTGARNPFKRILARLEVEPKFAERVRAAERDVRYPPLRDTEPPARIEQGAAE